MGIHRQNRNGVWYARGFQTTPDGQRVPVHRSLGIAVAPGTARDADRVIQRIVRDILAGSGGCALAMTSASAGGLVESAVRKCRYPRSDLVQSGGAIAPSIPVRFTPARPQGTGRASRMNSDSLSGSVSLPPRC